MKNFYTIIVVIALCVQPVSAQWTQPCNIINDELAITIETGSYSGVSMEVTDVDEDSSATYTFPHPSAYTDAEQPVKRGNCDWIAQTNGSGGTYPNVVELAPNTIYLFDFLESNVVMASFLYVACTYPVPPSLSFYCGIDTGGQTNALTDLYVIYSPGGNAFEAHMKGFQESFDITSAFSDNNWMMPHDMHRLCSVASPGDMADCMDGNEFKIFLSGQRNPQSLTHTAADLIVSAGTGWSHSWAMDGAGPAGDVELKMTSGTGIIVRGDLDLENVTIAGVSGGSWDGVDFDAGSSGNLSYASVSGAGITVSNADVSIDHSTLTGSTGTAIAVTGSSTEVDVSYTQISGYSEGISFTSTAFGHLWQSAIDVSGTAFSTSYYADPYIGPYPYHNGGTNELLGDWISIGGYYGSTIWGGSSGYNGNNYICDGASHIDALEDATSTVTLRGNYWPSRPPNASTGVDTTNVLGTTPGGRCPPGLGKGFRSLAEDPTDDGDARLLEASLLMWEAAQAAGGPDEAMLGRAASILKEVRAAYSGRPQAVAALVALFRLARIQGTVLQRSYFEELASAEGADRAAALGILVQAYQYWDDPSRARSSAEQLAALYPDEWHAFYAGLSLVEMDVAAGDLAAAANRLDGLAAESDVEAQHLDRAWDGLVRRSGGNISRPPARRIVAGPDLQAGEAVVTNLTGYPNPFNPTTSIAFDLVRDSDVRVVVYDVLGRDLAVLANGRLLQGRHAVTWDASRVPSGVYFAVVQAGGKRMAIAMTLLN